MCALLWLHPIWANWATDYCPIKKLKLGIRRSVRFSKMKSHRCASSERSTCKLKCRFNCPSPVNLRSLGGPFTFPSPSQMDALLNWQCTPRWCLLGDLAVAFLTNLHRVHSFKCTPWRGVSSIHVKIIQSDYQRCCYRQFVVSFLETHQVQFFPVIRRLAP